MLVLNRRVDEAILIGSDITIAVLSIKGSQVKIAIEAPKDVKIWREELVDKPMEVEEEEETL